MRFRIKAILAVVISMVLIVQPAFSQSSTSTPATTGTPDVNDSTDTTDTTVSTPPTTTSTTTTPTTSQPIVPAITEEEADAQALAETPPPQQVFDLADAGVVYGILTEGVAAWIASLEGNVDEWGNEVSSVYVSATRPDVVPASLQTFLLAYYKDNPTIGLAYGPEGVKEAETHLDQVFDEAVEERGDKIYEEAVKEAEEAEALRQQEEAENAEDVPPLDDDTDNGEDPEEEEAAVSIASISPSDFDLTGSAQTLDILGSGFGSDPAAVTVDFCNGFTGIVKSASETSLSVTVPDDFTAVNDCQVTITVNGEATTGVTISARPTTESASQSQVTDGDDLIILGYGYSGTASSNMILFQATTDGREDIEMSADSADFLSSSQKSQLTINSVPVTAETTGIYNIIVLTDDIQAAGTSTIEFVLP